MKLIKSFIIFILFSGVLLAEITGITTEKVISSSAMPTKALVKAGDELEIQLNISMLDYWYTYSTEMQLNDEGIGPQETSFMFLPEGHLELIGNPIVPKPKQKYDDGFEMDLKYYNGNISFVFKAKALKDLDFSKDSSYIEVYIQVCDTTRCLPPSPVMVLIGNEIIEKAEVNFTPSKVGNHSENKIESKDKENKSGTVTNSRKEIDEAKEKGALSYLLLSMLAGLGALGTPCVFPMIPITVSFFTKRAEKANAKSLTDALLFMLGIILTFTLLGVILTLILGATGVSDIATNPYANMIVAAVFIILAFNLFGAFEIQLPNSVINNLNQKSQSSGRLGIILMGIVFSLTSFTCTVPFVGASLQSTASSGDLTYPIIGMIGFSFVFSIPFFFFALFPTLIKKLPKSGGWMNNLKVTLGFLEIAAAIKFISNVDLAWGLEIITRDVFLSIWVACGVLIILYLIGTYKMKLDSKLESVGGVRAVITVFFTAVTIYLFTGLFGKNLGEVDAYLPPQEYGNNSQSASVFNVGNANKENIVWMKDYDKAVAKAKAEGKQLFIDFTGWQCTNCRWMEKNRFTDPQISSLLSEMITVKLYTDRRSEPELSNKQLQMDRFNSIELPLYVLQDPDETPLGTIAFTRDKQEFVDFLNTK
ncbi:cytochrome c biogenesis protein CcdA [Candidatus Kapabacteria bacterium]|nr:cytochrome c biogenesis protein CcdA [Candidatus Kapabacteria bacterium]